MIVKCLAHVPTSYYPKLSLVSKRFHSLISSSELRLTKYNTNTQETILYVCLQLQGRPLPSWFSLWSRPDQILTNDIKEKKMSTRNNTMLVGIPSQYSPTVPQVYIPDVGFKSYAVVQDNTPSSSPMYVRDNRRIHPPLCKAPRMKVARANPLVCMLDKKIYIIGGCNAHESKNWGEVFVAKTQTWEYLPDPGPELRFSMLKKIYTSEGKVYVSCTEKNDYFYDPKESRWGVVAGETLKVEISCTIADVSYYCSEKRCLWYDTKLKKWRVVKGLEVLNKNWCARALAIANYGGKLLIFWDKFQHPGQCRNKNFWCSVIALERRNGDDEVWCNVEWASVVLTLPSSYVFLRYEVVPD